MSISINDLYPRLPFRGLQLGEGAAGFKCRSVTDLIRLNADEFTRHAALVEGCCIAGDIAQPHLIYEVFDSTLPHKSQAIALRACVAILTDLLDVVSRAEDLTRRIEAARGDAETQGAMATTEDTEDTEDQNE